MELGVKEGVTVSYGCDCGATDCPRCYPGSMDWAECGRCGQEFRRYKLVYVDSDRYLCDECLAEVEEEREAEGAGLSGDA